MDRLEAQLPHSLSLRYPQALQEEMPGIEERFRDAYVERSLTQVRLVAVVLVAIYLVYIPLTAGFDFGGPFPERVTVLALETFGLLTSLTFLVFAFRIRSLAPLQGVTGLTTVIIGAQSSAVALLFTHPYDYIALQSLVLIFVVVYTSLRLRFVNALGAALAILAAFFVEALAFGRLPGNHLLQVGVYMVTANAVGALAAYGLERTLRHDFLQGERLAREQERSEQLLLTILPRSVAERLKAGERPIADLVPQATVVFADLVGFTQLSASLTPEELVRRLGLLFSAFDAETERLGLEKIKTIGDAYMAAAGVPTPRDDHATAAADLALALRDVVERMNAEHGWDLGLRVGLHSGPVVAGVIGEQRFTYDVWGDTVNTASRMESHGVPGQVQLSSATRELLGDAYAVEARGELEVKGKGPMQTFLLRGASRTT